MSILTCCFLGPVGWLRRKPLRMHLALVVLILLSACQSAPPVQAGPTATHAFAPRLGPTSTPKPSVTPDHSSPTGTPTFVPVPTPSAADWQTGPPDAQVTLVAYMDFQCAPCLRMAQSIRAVMARHPGQVRLIVRPFVLEKIEDKAVLATVSALAAGQQGDFWGMYNLLFERANEWRTLTPDEFVSWLSGVADSLGLDVSTFNSAIDDPALSAEVKAETEKAQASGVPGAPFVLFNGRPFLLAGDPTQLEAAVRLTVLESRQVQAYPALSLRANKTYIARLDTNLGPITIQLFPESAPLAVNSFVFLANQGWYDGCGAYLVVPGSYIETGDPTDTGLGEVGYHFPVESNSVRRFDRPGMVGAVSSGPDAVSARFFFSLAPMPQLNGSRTIFGQVVSGVDILQSLKARQPLQDLLTPPELIIQKVEIEIR